MVLIAHPHLDLCTHTQTHVHIFWHTHILTHTHRHTQTYAVIHNFTLVPRHVHTTHAHSQSHTLARVWVWKGYFLCFLRLPKTLGIWFKFLDLAFGICHMESQHVFPVISIPTPLSLSLTSIRSPVGESQDYAGWQGGCEVDGWCRDPSWDPCFSSIPSRTSNPGTFLRAV